MIVFVGLVSLVMVDGGEVEDARPGGSKGFLLMAAENLRRSIEFSVGQLRAKKVRGEVKLRWSRSLARQVEALVKVAEALNRIGASLLVMACTWLVSCLNWTVRFRRGLLKETSTMVGKRRGTVYRR